MLGAYSISQLHASIPKYYGTGSSTVDAVLLVAVWFYLFFYIFYLRSFLVRRNTIALKIFNSSFLPSVKTLNEQEACVAVRENWKVRRLGDHG